MSKLAEGTKITLGAQAYNLLNRLNFAVPSNTQVHSPWEGMETTSSKTLQEISPATRPNILCSQHWASDSTGCAVDFLTDHPKKPRPQKILPQSRTGTLLLPQPNTKV